MEGKRPTYTGRIERMPDGEIRGSIRELVTGWPIDLVLTKAVSGHGYDVKGFMGELPGKPNQKKRM